MPNAPETRRYDRHSGTSKIDAQQQMINLFEFPSLYDLGKVANDALKTPGSRGRRSHYPATALLAVAVAARATASLPEACRLLRGQAWEECRKRYDAFRERDDAPLPTTPPSRDAVFYFMEKLADNDEVRARLHEQFLRSSIGLARYLGNLRPGIEPNWAAPDPRHTIYGDGTYITPYSDVIEVVDPLTHEPRVLGSSATVRPARLVRDNELTKGSHDGKAHLRGINHVALSTWTVAGRLVLHVGQAFGAESTETLRLVDELADHAGDGLHTLVYDRAITGWIIDYLMGRHRIQTIGKGVARSSTTQLDDAIKPVHGSVEAEQTEAMKRLAAEHGVEFTRDIAPLLRPRVLDRLANLGGAQPVGTSVYPTKKGYDVVRGKYFWLGQTTHPTSQGTCVHDLAVDDGALYTVSPDPEHGWAMKSAKAECISSKPSRGPRGWTVTNTWRVPCHVEAFEHTTRWSPPARRGASPHHEDSRTHLPTALRELRPLSRADGERFGRVHGRRNDSESFNNWYKNRLDHKGRAASLRPARQDVDFLAGALLNNSNTWQLGKD